MNSDLLIDGYGNMIGAGTTVMTTDIDGNMVYGTLKKGETFRSKCEWFVTWDDGLETIVLEPKLLFKA